MKKVLTKEMVGGSYVIDTIKREENNNWIKVFTVTCENWNEPHTVWFEKEESGEYHIKDYTLGKMYTMYDKWSDLKNLNDFFIDIDIAEMAFEKGYGKKI